MKKFLEKLGYACRWCIALAAHYPNLRMDWPVLIEKDVTFKIAPTARITLKKRVYLKKGCILEASDHGHITIGEQTNVGHYAWIGCSYKVEIGKLCAIGQGATIFDVLHTKDPRMPFMTQGYAEYGEIRIEDDVIITAKATIGPNLHIAKGVIVAQNSIVSKSIEEENAIYGGMPAKKIKDR